MAEQKIRIDRTAGEVTVDMIAGHRHPVSWSVSLRKPGQTTSDRKKTYLFDPDVESNQTVSLGDATTLIGSTLVLVFTIYRANPNNADFYEVKGVVGAAGGSVEGGRLGKSGNVDQDRVKNQLEATFEART
jgi:hypothetical protein